MKRKKGSAARRRDALSGYLFIAPWLVGFLLLTAYPVVYSILLSLNSVQIKTTGTVLQWQGFSYYNQALNVDTAFKLNLGEAMMFIGCATPVILVFALIIALLLNGKYPLRLLFRAVFFLPVIIMSGPVISQLLTKYTTDFTNEGDFIYAFLNSMPQLIRDPAMFVLSNLVLILWFSGVQILIFLVGLQKIGAEVYEAASIDGAGVWEKFWKITLPHLTPMALISAVYTVVEIANFSNNKINQQIAGQMFETNRPYSFSAAMAWIYFLSVVAVLLVVLLVFYGFQRRKRA